MNIQSLLTSYNNPAVVYTLTVFIVSVVLILFILAKMNRLNILRRERLKKRKVFTAVRTTAPGKDQEKTARRIGMKSIETQFTVSKRIIIPFIVVSALMIASIPFVDKIPGTLLSLLVGIITVILGIAARPFIENFIAGLLISYSKIVNIGDTILIHKTYGTVEDITPSHTIVKIWDWRRYIIPNSKMLQSELINYSTNDMYQWAHIEFYISYDSNLSLVEKIAREAPCNSKYFEDSEEPRFWIMEMDKEGILCWLAAWANSPANAWSLKHDMRTELITRLYNAGIRTHQYFFVEGKTKERTKQAEVKNEAKSF